jgi:hypothetical protein
MTFELKYTTNNGHSEHFDFYTQSQAITTGDTAIKNVTLSFLHPHLSVSLFYLISPRQQFSGNRSRTHKTQWNGME